MGLLHTKALSRPGPLSPINKQRPPNRHAQHPPLHILLKTPTKCHSTTSSRACNRNNILTDRSRARRKRRPTQPTPTNNLLRRMERLGSHPRRRKPRRRGKLYALRRTGCRSLVERFHPEEQGCRHGLYCSDGECYFAVDDYS